MTITFWNFIVWLAAFLFSYLGYEFFRRHLFASTWFIVAACLAGTPFLPSQTIFDFSKYLFTAVALVLICLFRIAHHPTDPESLSLFNQLLQSACKRLLSPILSHGQGPTLDLHHYIRWFVALTIFMNIASAALVLLPKGYYVNAAAGLVLAACVPLPNATNKSYVLQLAPHCTLLIRLDMAWILLFTFWIMGMHYQHANSDWVIFSLVTPVPSCIHAWRYRRQTAIDKTLFTPTYTVWFSAILFMYSMYFIFFVLPRDAWQPYYGNPDLFNYHVSAAWSIVNLAGALLYVRFRFKKPPTPLTAAPDK